MWLSEHRQGDTGPDGWVRFVESVRPQPRCNLLEVILPATGERWPAGCHDGFKELSKTFNIQAGGGVKRLQLQTELMR